jgi:hypothetical protein
MKSWKPEVMVNGQWASNALRFKTKEEAESNAANLMYRWTMVQDFRAGESEDEPTHAWIDGALHDLSRPDAPGYVPPYRVSIGG